MTTLSPLRKGLITGSRIPKLTNRKGTPEQLRREMVREHFGDEPDPVNSPAIDYGNAHEAELVAEYELTRGRVVRFNGEQQRTVLHPKYPHLFAATPDGWLYSGSDVEGLLEGKNPWRARYQHWSQRPDIEAQMRLQADCAEADWVDLAVRYEGEPLYVSRLTRDPAWLTAPIYDGSSVLDLAQAFLDELAEIVADPERAAPYRAPLKGLMADPEAIAAADELEDWQIIRQAAEQAEARAHAALVAQAKRSGAKSTRIGPFLVTRSEPSGRIDYRKALAKFSPDADLTPFRSEPKGEPTWTIRRSTK